MVRRINMLESMKFTMPNFVPIGQIFEEYGHFSIFQDGICRLPSWFQKSEILTADTV